MLHFYTLGDFTSYHMKMQQVHFVTKTLNQWLKNYIKHIEKNQKVLSECSVTKVQFSVRKNAGQKCERATDAGYFRLW